MDEISALFQPVLLIVIPALAVMATVYLLELWRVKKAQLSQEQITLLNWIVNSAVWSTEQAWRTGVITKELRESHAVGVIQAELDTYGLKGINVQQIVNRVKAAVAQELNKAKIVAPSPAKNPTDLPTGP